MTHPATVQNRRRSWPVILALVLAAVAAVSWAVARMGDKGEETVAVDVPAKTDSATTTPVQDYLQFAATVREGKAQDSRTDPDYIVDGLRRLAGALGTLNVGDLDLQTDLRVAAEHVALNPASTATTNVVRDGLISAAEAMDSHYRNGQVKLRPLAESISPDTPLLHQAMAVREFFRESANAIQRLSRQG